MSKLIEMKGKRFGKLLVKERVGSDKHRNALWGCICDCGKESIVAGCDLRTKNTKSCGCTRNFKHGLARRKSYHPLFKTWKNMVYRCTKPKAVNYKYYGGRGITVCDRWLNIHNFITDMGPKPGPDYSIDRIDNDGDYCPENCRWAKPAEQSRNKRNNRMLTFKGRTMCLADWAKELSIPERTLWHRLERNWPLKRALSS